MFEFLATNFWVVWIVLILVFGIVEIFTLDFLCLMLSGGSIIGLFVSLLSVPWPITIVVAMLASVVLIFFVRPGLQKYLQRDADETPSNIDAILGITGVVLPTSGTTDSPLVRLANGETWSAQRSSVNEGLTSGTQITVLAVNGATVVVEAIGKKTK